MKISPLPSRRFGWNVGLWSAIFATIAAFLLSNAALMVFALGVCWGLIVAGEPAEPRSLVSLLPGEQVLLGSPVDDPEGECDG